MTGVVTETDSLQPSRKRVFVHIGAPKTGTSFLQQVLWRNRAALAADGVCYPLERPGEHRHAALDLRKMAWAGRRDPQWEGAWERIAERTRGWDGHRVVISNELLGGASAGQVREAVRSLGPAEAHVVLTARDLARQIPSGWQEHLKHQHPVTFDEFLDDLLLQGTDGRYGRMFWRVHDVEEVLRRWREAVPVDRIHVITIPQPGARGQPLWERFAEVVGIDPERYDTNVTRDNASVGTAEAELLYRVNRTLDRRLPPEHYDPIIRRQLAERILSRRPEKTRIVLPPERYPQVVEHAKQLMAEVTTAGYDVVGDVNELFPPPPREERGAGQADDAMESEVLDAAVDAVTGLALHMSRMRERPGAAVEPPSQPPIAKRVVRDLSERHALVMRTRRAWWRTAERAERVRRLLSPRR